MIDEREKQPTAELAQEKQQQENPAHELDDQALDKVSGGNIFQPPPPPGSVGLH